MRTLVTWVTESKDPWAPFPRPWRRVGAKPMSEATERALHVAEHAVHDYAPGEERPLLDHAALVGVYGAAVAGLSLIVRRRRRLPERIPASDLALLSVATHKLSRLL